MSWSASWWTSAPTPIRDVDERRVVRRAAHLARSRASWQRLHLSWDSDYGDDSRGIGWRTKDAAAALCALLGDP